MSTWKSNLKKKYDEHKHCPVCGISIPLNKEFCSQECKDKYQTYEKKKKRSTNLQLLLPMFFMIVFLIIMQIFASG